MGTRARTAEILSAKILIDVKTLATLLSLSERSVRRLDATRQIPGRVTVGRRVLYRTDEIQAWIDRGLHGCS